MRIGELALYGHAHAEGHEIVKSVYRGFCEAKQAAMDQPAEGVTFDNMAVMVPWLTPLLQADRETLDGNWWPYGIDANRPSIEAVLRFHHEQGVTSRRFAVEEIFVDYLDA